MTWLKWAAIPWGIVLSLLWMGAMHIYAQSSIPDPDELAIEQVTAYSGVINTDDMLAVIQYRIDYATLPSLAATDTFICRFLVNGAEVNASEIISFNDLGYGLGVCSVYFTTAELVTAGIEYANPNAEDYEISVQGKPSAFASPPQVLTSSINYRSAAQTAQLLLTDIANLATSLQNNAAWRANGFTELITFTSGQQVLSDTGAAYFGQAVPNLQIMIPDLFGSSTTTPDVTERDYEFSERDRLQTLWDSSPIGPFITMAATNFGLSNIWILSIIGLVMVAGATVVAKERAGAPELGILVALIAFPLVVAAGLGTMTAVFFVTALAIIGLMFSLFLRRAG